MTCNRCKAPLTDKTTEWCWWCHEPLCDDCWDKHGHCGHPEADEINRKAREHDARRKDA
jgi:hypothetical protein